MDFKQLASFFKNAELPMEPVKISPCETIIDAKKFVESSLDTLKYNTGNKRYIPHYHRLIKFYKLLTK